MATGFRGPLLYTRIGHPFDQLPMDMIQRAVLNDRFGVQVANGIPYVGPAAAGSAGGWTMAETATGGGSVVMNNLGQLVITGGTADEDNTGLQYLTLPFRYSATRDIACFGRMKVSTATTTDMLFGLFGLDTTLVAASAIAVDNGIGFFKADTATDLTAHVRKATVSTGAAAMGLTIASDTFFTCGFTVTNGAVRFYAGADVNDVIAASDSVLGAGVSVVNTTAPNTVDTFLTFMVGQEGGTTARVLTIDWAFAVQKL